ncbi:hypothetical protein N7481_009074 [Penicillium waksmanii]|uniref:uncharacterized protein n=1 Tax=Penicillium waksmanii TaxID=69791 RepID=UPI0025474B35|nr:uncharacterized protein N7481_009074 [Penicillium waksmanii]KAJ5975367.1 hypothetical protein N7481_009074 [Penicillium waksmanii]
MANAGKIYFTNEQIDAEWATHMKGAVAPPITQATHLPEGPISLPVVNEKLTRVTNWIDWERSVRGILITNSLYRLIDKTIPRPRPTTEMGENWCMKGRLDVIFADDIWKALATICKGQRIFSDAKAWTTFTGMRASDYNNIDSYTVAYASAFNTANDAGFNISWKGSILGYLAGVAVFNAQVADKAMQ